MATFKILYWQEIPSQISAEEGGDEVRLELSHRFMERIDQLAHQRNLHNSDDYLAQWRWSDEEDRPGSAGEVAAAIKTELEAKNKW